MDLRPHHAMCIQKFTGHGYDETFTRHMTGLVSALRENPGTRVRIVPGADELCSACPNNLSGTCTSLPKVAAMDEAAERLCGLAPGEELTWGELSARARGRIFDTAEFDNICQSCQWYELCRSTPIQD